MTAYRAYGRVIESDRSLPELAAMETPATPDIIVTWSGRASIPAPVRWTTLWRFSTGEPWVTTSRGGGVRRLRFGRYLDCELSERRIVATRRGHASEATLRHLILDQALPLALASQGSLVVHASAVSDGRRAIVIAGHGGAGKSTLAAMLARMGMNVLADDGVLLERRGLEIRALPSYPGLRLYRDSAITAGFDAPSGIRVAEYTRKRRVVPPGCSIEDCLALGPMYVLSHGSGAIELEQLSRRDAAVELLAHTYRPDPADRVHLESELSAVVALAPPMWRLSYPRHLARAADVASAVAAHAGALAHCRGDELRRGSIELDSEMRDL